MCRRMDNTDVDFPILFLAKQLIQEPVFFVTSPGSGLNPGSETGSLVGWLVGWMVGWLVGWLLACLLAWLLWLLGCLVAWLLGAASPASPALPLSCHGCIWGMT